MGACDANQVENGCKTVKLENGDTKCLKDGKPCPVPPNQSGGNPKITNDYRKKYLSYKIKYQLGGDGHSMNESSNWTNKQSEDKFNYLQKKIGLNDA